MSHVHWERSVYAVYDDIDIVKRHRIRSRLTHCCGKYDDLGVTRTNEIQKIWPNKVYLQSTKGVCISSTLTCTHKIIANTAHIPTWCRHTARRPMFSLIIFCPQILSWSLQYNLHGLHSKKSTQIKHRNQGERNSHPGLFFYKKYYSTLFIIIIMICLSEDCSFCFFIYFLFLYVCVVWMIFIHNIRMYSILKPQQNHNMLYHHHHHLHHF